MKHTLKLTTANDTWVHFGGSHQLGPFVKNREHGTEPYGPFRCSLGTSMPRQDWEAAGHPLEVEVEL